MREDVKGWAAAMAVTIAMATACGGGTESKPSATAGVPAAASLESTMAAAARATAAASAASPTGARVLILGTSLTAGLGLDPDSAYPAVLQRLADSSGYRTTIVAAGLSGETSAGALRRVDWLLRDKADVVVIETGANDGLRGLRVDTTRANIVAIVRKVRAANPEARVLLAQMEAPPNLGPQYTRDFHETFMTVSRDEGITLIPFFLNGVAGDRDLNQEDGIHPNAEGARRAARNMWRTLGPVLREVPGVLDR
jgi:acyl-CoA thioesterase I